MTNPLPRKFPLLFLFAIAATFAQTPRAAAQAQLPPGAASKQWTWVNGANISNQAGTYGTQGTPDAANVPGARDNAASCTDAAGNFWLFGGDGYDAVGTNGELNDLWEFSGGRWTWVSGSRVANANGVYGTRGAPDPANYPGARYSPVIWADAAGNIWVFGGYGYDSAGTNSMLDDLWKFSAGQWTWMGGFNEANHQGVYGIQGRPSANNLPGARDSAVTWTDGTGNLWLFGGFGYDASGTSSYLGDLWTFSAGQWTWVAGPNVMNQRGKYGTRGAPAPGNFPGARYASVAWTDAAGNLWLFGGLGYDSAGNWGTMNDVWKFSAGQWTWMGGSNVVDQQGTYGTQGTPSGSNIPGTRSSAVGATDAAGNFWLFGGAGFDSVGTQSLLNDLWEFSAGQWTWRGGQNVISMTSPDLWKGTYGTQGSPAAANVPGVRYNAVAWTDAAGNFWLFGGSGFGSDGAQGALNDLWKYGP
jgi:N-acetylneuraminic acid mutarotase